MPMRMQPPEAAEILCENLTQGQAEAYSLVLVACSLPCFTRKTGQKWQLWVGAADRLQALDLIRQYELENTAPLPESDNRYPREERKTLSAFWISLFLLVVHAITARPEVAAQYVAQYSADAFDILHGEVYRAVTSLMLHAGYLHLAGNIVGLAVFGTALCKITGPGHGWLIILLNGAGGNLVNAAVIQRDHASIGASTAVFGALGFLSAYQAYRKIAVGDRSARVWLPLAGGLALLGFLGSGTHTDLTAHLFGFLTGIGSVFLYISCLSRFRSRKHQWISAAVALLLIGLAGIWPLVFK